MMVAKKAMPSPEPVRKLMFPADGVRRVVEHALSCNTEEIVLVHDVGVYLVSGGDPPDYLTPGSTDTHAFSVFAKGTSPEDPNPVEQSKHLVGEDAFVERLPWASDIKAILDKGVKNVVFEVSPSTLFLITWEVEK